MAWSGIVLTGCAGFIGLNFLKQVMSQEFLDNWDAIVLVDKMGYATKYNAGEYKRILDKVNIKSCDSNINDIDKLNTFYNPCSGSEIAVKWTVVDFASESHVDNSIKNPDTIFQENAAIPSNLIRWLGGVSRINHYIHISTDEVYGDIPFEFRGKEFFTPESMLKPSNPYSASKVAQDMYLHSLHKTYGMHLILIRMANQFGPWQHPEKMLPASVLRALRGESIKVYGSGNNCRQWTYAPDTVGLIYDIFGKTLQKQTGYEVHHLADQKNLIDNNELVEKLINILQDYNVSTSIEYVEDRKGHDAVYALATEPYVDKQYTHKFEYALGQTVEFYVKGFKDGKYN